MIVLDVLTFIITLGIFVVPIYLIIKKRRNKPTIIKEKTKENEKIKEKPKKIKAEGKMRAKLVNGIDYLSEGQLCSLWIENDKVVVDSKVNKLNLNISQIVNIALLTKKEIEKKDKSVIGRAAVGSIFGFGLLGAISGIGQKSKKINKYFLIISYKAKDNEDIQNLTFGLDMQGYIENRFVKMVTKRIKEKANVEL